MREYNDRYEFPNPDIVIDPDAEYLLIHFEALSQFRNVGINGPLAIMPDTVREWCQVTGTRLTRDEVNILFKADTAYRAAYYEEQDRQMKLARETPPNG